ncbi:hypothetical protein LTR53_012509 [Teratosphaeriaceae sp. CCFEE 6253]|nr:hypothetical protein LTR53_012509 [Teratosphaeriaceae sp. CCFEE 6253]
MTISRKRKQTSADDSASTSTQSLMETFARVSKEHSIDSGSKKRKMAHLREATPPASIQQAPAKEDKKRKRQLDSVAEEQNALGADTLPRMADTNPRDPHASTPPTKRFKTALPRSPIETPSKSALALFGRLRLNSTTVPLALAGRRPGIDTPPPTPEAGDDSEAQDWPVELQDLCDLHRAFLSALSMYYAYNGSTSPVNVCALLPMITNNWKKRNVSLEDLRRVLAVHHKGQPEFALEIGGNMGVCLSRIQSRGRALKRAASYMDEDDMNGRFEQALQASWARWQVVAQKQDNAVGTFVAQLPLAQTMTRASASSVSPLFARGQQRLADIKSAQASASSVDKKLQLSMVASQQSDVSPAVQNRGTSLLDRVLARQALASSLPSRPSKEQVERNAALHRIEDVARVLGLLVGAKARVTLGMQAMVQQLQQSLRNPISREEVERCLELMAAEITPGFVNVIMSGSVKCVTVRRDRKPDVVDLRMNVQRAGARENTPPR